ncbi:hypothetical protein FH972_023435 [Carpinus fangiana]|uniref:SGNH hydrolase-type esterase domain-containing protein n=1 Tax=Carpinus fangiana TaxID=176857 RepID=A0A5N6KVN2_9ROSI|nr:hypothetical protein FH972_023435 [Carpinus fangiana]
MLSGTTPLYSSIQTVTYTSMFQNVTSLGSQQDGNFTQNYNEGHPAARIDGIQANFTQALPSYPNAADVVFLMAGINDVAGNYNLSTAPARLGGLIDLMFSSFPNTVVIVAQCSPVTYKPWEALKVQFNAAIPPLVQARVDQGMKIVMVNMSAALTTADLADIAHPTEAGYMKMATEWFRGVNVARQKGWL